MPVFSHAPFLPDYAESALFLRTHVYNIIMANKMESERKFIQHKLATQRRNLLGVSKMCVKSLVDKAAFEAVSDDCSHLENFCTAMEHIFAHRIQVRRTLFSGSESPPFWLLVSRLAPPPTIMSVQDMENIHTDLGRCRAWIRLMLVQKRLSDFMSSLLSKHDVLQTVYQPGAFLLSDELTEIAGTIKCLDTIDFNLCLRDRDFNFGEKKEIDYSSYLTFHQSSSSKVDDIVEEQKLSSSHRVSFPWQPEIWAGSSEVAGEEEGEGGGGGGGGRKVDTPAQLRELLKMEREQKNYFEELVSVRDNQLSRIQLELTSLSEEREKERAELEVVILELQQQLEKQFMEARALQQAPESSQSSRKNRAASLSPSFAAPQGNSTLSANCHQPVTSTLSPPPPPSSSSSGSSGRLRNSSFSMFSGFLRSRSTT